MPLKNILDRNIILWLLSIIAAIILDTQASLFGLKTALTILVMYYIARQTQYQTALLWAAGCGLILDSVNKRIIGPNMLGLGVIVMIINYARLNVINWTRLFNTILCMVITLTNGLITYLSLMIFDSQPIPLIDALQRLMPQTVLNGAIVLMFWKRHE